MSVAPSASNGHHRFGNSQLPRGSRRFPSIRRAHAPCSHGVTKFRRDVQPVKRVTKAFLSPSSSSINLFPASSALHHNSYSNPHTTAPQPLVLLKSTTSMQYRVRVCPGLACSSKDTRNWRGPSGNASRGASPKLASALAVRGVNRTSPWWAVSDERMRTPPPRTCPTSRPPHQQQRTTTTNSSSIAVVLSDPRAISFARVYGASRHHSA